MPIISFDPIEPGDISLTLSDGVVRTFKVTNWSMEDTATPIADIKSVQQTFEVSGYATRGSTLYVSPVVYEWIRLIPRRLREIGRKINRRKNRSRH